MFKYYLSCIILLSNSELIQIPSSSDWNRSIHIFRVVYSRWGIGDIILSCKFGQVYWLYSKMLECEIVVAIPSSSHTITHTHTLSHNRQAQTGAEREEETGCNYYHCWLSLLKPERTQGVSQWGRVVSHLPGTVYTMYSI